LLLVVYHLLFSIHDLRFTNSRLPTTIPAVDVRIQREFLAEIEELVEQLFADTEELRRRETQGPARREVLARIFRHVHSIKGVSATAGFNQVSELAHQTESLLDGARSGRIAVEDAFVETLEEAANAISESLGAVAGGTDTEPPASLIQSFHDLKLPDAAVDVESEVPLPDLPADISASLNEGERQLLHEAVRENEKLYLVTAVFNVAAFDKEFQELRTTLTQHGSVISTLPSTAGSRSNSIAFRVFCSSALKLAELQERLSAFSQVTVEGLANEAYPFVTGGPTPIASLAPSSHVPIEVEELDRLISSSHELFGQTVAALDLISAQLADASQIELRNLDAQIRQSLVSLEEQIIQLRMVSLDRVMQRAIRAGRVAARVSGKEVEFSVAGSELRIDKLVCDAIADPLLHLVRNAVDQGIETPDERERAGKPGLGSVRVEASSAGGRVRFLVADDGRGIDERIVSAAAAKLGLIEPGTLLSSEKSLRMIFRPGFSTAASVSSVSGRGVGLDVVESAVERAGGAVHVRTHLGKGTEFEIRLPASLGVLRALIVSSGSHRYCVDANQVVDHFEITAAKASRFESGKSIRWHDQELPLVGLEELLGQPAVEPKGWLPVIVCEIPGEAASDHPQHRALVVESVVETQEVLVRGLGRHAALWRGVVGAAELRDGGVALVLDLPFLCARIVSVSGV
jgi:two-component system chemotaxis sensor kinase CheA